MTDPIVLPDAIEASVAYLNTVEAVTELVDDRIGTRLPTAEAWPAVRLDPTGGFPVLEYRFDRPRLQVHYFDVTDLGAMTGARTVRAAFVAMPGYRIADQVVVDDVVTSTPQLVDDEGRTPPISHATFSATVTLRPDP